MMEIHREREGHAFAAARHVAACSFLSRCASIASPASVFFIF
jgi:hypothetical protein